MPFNGLVLIGNWHAGSDRRGLTCTTAIGPIRLRVRQAVALDLSEQSYRLHIGVFFAGRHGTLNLLLLTDRLWLKRLTGEGDHPNRLDAILYEDRTDLAVHVL